MIPRLQRFYGGRPQDWLKIPSWLLRAYSEMQSVLYARESVQRINEMSYAYGSMKAEDGRSFIQELNRMAEGRHRPKPYRPQTIEDLTRLMRGVGEGM